MGSIDDDPIELVASRHDAWRTVYRAERDRLEDALAAAEIADAVHRIEHVGSTAVPDLAAKDIVDVNVIVADDAVGAVAEAVGDALGGERYENSDTWQFLARTVDGQRVNVHVFARSSRKWRTSVVTRDVLRARPELRDEYESLKRELAAATDDVGEYSRGKTDLLARLLEEARHAEDLPFDFDVPSEP
jgi:GrpB-like predicted nucleotidyltransferase (UPF0157 family)